MFLFAGDLSVAASPTTGAGGEAGKARVLVTTRGGTAYPAYGAVSVVDALGAACAGLVGDGRLDIHGALACQGTIRVAQRHRDRHFFSGRGRAAGQPSHFYGCDGGHAVLGLSVDRAQGGREGGRQGTVTTKGH